MTRASYLLRRGPRPVKGEEGETPRFVLRLGDGPSDEERAAARTRDPEPIGKIWVDGVKRELLMQPASGEFYFELDAFLDLRSTVTLDGHEYVLCRSDMFPLFIHIVDLKSGYMMDALDAHNTAEKSATTR